MLKNAISILCVLGCTVTACNAVSVDSELTVNGRLFGPDECRNGQTEEFFGVDLKEENGTVLRLATNPDKTISVILFPNDGTRPVNMTGCAQLSLKKSDNDHEGYYEVDGSASIDCSGSGWTVKGRTDFENCKHEY
jgi:hypothetical protein